MRKKNAARFNPRYNQPPHAERTTAATPVGTPARATTPPGRFCPPIIRHARPQDLRFISHLQKKFSNELGFLPLAALEWYVHNRRVGVVTENGEPAGYVLGRERYNKLPDLRPITQTAICFDAQRRHLGMALVERVVKHAVDARQLAVQAVCAEDIEANEFWRLMNFHLIGTHTAMNQRGRKLHVWRRLTTSQLPEWFWTMPTNPGHRRGTRSSKNPPPLIAGMPRVFSDIEIDETPDAILDRCPL